jgi:anti-sigma B factor antagonist
VCRPIGDLDAYTICQFRQVLSDVAEYSRVVIDVSRVGFVDSAGLAALIGGIRRARDLGGDVAIACGRPCLNRLLRRVGLDRIVSLSVDIRQATMALQAGVTVA